MSGHVVESTSELSAFMKAGVMAGSERDAGFCSGGDEDDMSGLHSPSASEDSVEVQVTPISLRNKRKLAEPRKIQETNSAPLKKRRFEQIEETIVTEEESRTIRSPSPFRPWSTSSKSSDSTKTSTTTSATATVTKSPVVPVPASLLLFGAPSTLPAEKDPQNRKEHRLDREDDEVDEHEDEDEEEEEDGRTETRKRDVARIQEGFPPRLRETERCRPESPVQARLQSSLVQRRETRQKSVEAVAHGNPTSTSSSISPSSAPPTTSPSSSIGLLPLTHPRLQEEPLSLVLRGEIPRVPSHPAVSGGYDRATYSLEQSSTSATPHHHHHHQNHPQSASSTQTNHPRQQQGGQQRNYKNMTRERRIEANARERTRVHTISAAFDTLRRAIPAYSHNQKLSKLSVLRIACSYIMTLGKIVNTPEGESANGASLGACVDLVSRTIQTEGKLRKRKED